MTRRFPPPWLNAQSPMQVAVAIAAQHYAAKHGGANGRFARMAAAFRKHTQAAARCNDGVDHQQKLFGTEPILYFVDKLMLDLIEDMGGIVVRSGLWT
jgi:hypothetical protein